MTTLHVNGRAHELDVPADATLADVLRGSLGLYGVRVSCSEGECGSCTVLLDGVSMNACLIMAPQVDGRDVLSVEGLATGDDLAPIQQAFVDCGAVQCGYCTPGLVVAAHALLAHEPCPTEEAIRKGLEGNICRCTGYMKITQAVQAAAAARATEVSK